MLSMQGNGGVVVRLVDGDSEQTELVFEAGRTVAPVSVGTRGAWPVQARLVGAAHVMLAWNGRSLFVAAARGQVAFLGGSALGSRWIEVHVPGELRFGDARLSIAMRVGDAADATCTADVDEDRLRAALELSRDGEATCIATIAIPPAAMRSAEQTSP